MDSIRTALQYDVADDWLPLHPSFYEFIQKDDDGNLFIEYKDGSRLPVRIKSETPE